MEPRRKRRRRLPRRRRIATRFNLGRALFVLPNLFTVSNIFCGFYAIVLICGEPGPEQFYRAGLAIFFGFFFDMADGRVARMTRTQSDFGVQLDSLSDMVTFGVAPALIVYRWGLSELGLWGIVVAFVYVACGALRLARFNVLAQRSPKVSKFFIGLPIPLAAGVLSALVMFHQGTFSQPATRTLHILVLVLVLSYLMISNVRYRGFKNVRPNKKSLTIFVGLIAVFVWVSVQIRPTFALLAFYGGYVGMGLLEEVIFYRRRRTHVRPMGPENIPATIDNAPRPITEKTSP